VTSCINTNSRIKVFASRENGVLEWETMCVLFINEVIEKISSQVLAEERGCTSWEQWESGNLIRALQVASNLDVSADELLILGLLWSS
jgi:hypothetical protein